MKPLAGTIELMKSLGRLATLKNKTMQVKQAMIIVPDKLVSQVI